MGNVFLHRRDILTDHSSAGTLFEPDGTLICNLLEDADRDLNPDGDWKSKKIFGETAIPYGFYELKMQFSNHFQKMMPYLQKVITHDGVMYHSGNFTSQTNGCPLVGDRIADDVVKNSQATFKDKLIPVLAKYFKGGNPVFVQVIKSDTVIDKRTVTVK